MAYYLQMDGIDDRLQLPSMTFTEIVLDMSVIRSTSSTKLYVDARTGIGFTYLQSNTNGTDSFSGFNSVYVDTVSKSNNTVMIPNDQRCTVRIVKNTAGTDDLTIFSQNSGSAGTFVQGKLYNVKVYNGTTLLAHYDMATQTVQDQSGNGRHGTLYGGTWLDDGTGGDTGTTGSSLFDIRNVIYSTSLFNYDSKQNIHQTSSQIFDTKNEIYNSSSTTYATKQIIFETISLMYDTLQQILDGGLIGSINFDLKFTLYSNNTSQYDMKQSLFQSSNNEFSLKQLVYEVSQLHSNLKQNIYLNSTNGFNTKQSIYQTGLDNYNVRNEIFNNSSTKYDVKQIINKLNSVEHDLKQTIYKSSEVDYNTMQQLLADFQIYRQLIEYVLQINTGNSYNLEINTENKYDLKI
ncbi:hypothetical protein [Metabacillus sp. Hm71]|uniref:hypothetical protein n=1 Tax=Metabacillus sp. Hm71 TaxID=3450743 RepID=UPI003F43688C